MIKLENFKLNWLIRLAFYLGIIAFSSIGLFVCLNFPTYNKLCKDYVQPEFILADNSTTKVSFKEMGQLIQTQFCFENKSSSSTFLNLMNGSNFENYFQVQKVNREYSNIGYLKIQFSSRLIQLFAIMVLLFCLSRIISFSSHVEFFPKEHEIFWYWTYTITELIFKNMSIILVFLMTLYLIIGGMI